MPYGIRAVVYACAAAAAALWTPANGMAQGYAVERVAGGLDHPTYVTQAPGDDNTLYIVEQRNGTGSSGSNFGRIRTLDLSTGVLQPTSNPLVTISGIDQTVEGGLHTMAFHPEFQQNGKFYVAWLENGVGGGNGDFGNVDEYQIAGGVASMTKRVFRYRLRDSSATHGLDWIGFDPTATGDAKNYLFITTGDGGFDGASTNFTQDLSTPYGKIFRIDVRGDAYPADAGRNYTIPPDNPYANDGNPNTREDVYHSGFRNPWRASFDRATGDMYVGDVGLSSREEIDFIKAGEVGLDFGWNGLEGTVVNPTGTILNPNSRLPIHEYSHATGFSITGGYVYRGPIAELQGKYFFGDFITGDIWMANFNRDVNPNTYNGQNMINVQKVDGLLESLIQGGGVIDKPVSFGEDNAGNLYIVDFGSGDPFNPLFDTGEVFRLVPTALGLVVDRSTGMLTLSNSAGEAKLIESITINSTAGSLDPAGWKSISANYDVDGPNTADSGALIGSVDADDAWEILSSTAAQLREHEPTGDGGSVGPGQSVELGQVWLQGRYEDLSASLTLADGTLVIVPVSFTGNDGNTFALGDLTFDGVVDLDDWQAMKDGFDQQVGSLTLAQAYQFGDLNGDLQLDLNDVNLFAIAYDADNGAGAFHAATGVPEPSAMMTTASALGLIGGCLLRRRALSQNKTRMT